MALTPDRPLQAHFWCPVIQSDAKMQPVSRSNRNHHAEQAYSSKCLQGKFWEVHSNLILFLSKSSSYSHPILIFAYYAPSKS
jgi:hypothetical protein